MAHKFVITKDKRGEYPRQIRLQQRDDVLVRRLFEQGLGQERDRVAAKEWSWRRARTTRPTECVR